MPYKNPEDKKKWAKRNKERLDIKRKLWYSIHKQEMRLYNQKYQKKHKQKIKIQKAKYRLKNKGLYRLKYPIKEKARNFAHNHKQRRNKCEQCNSIKNLHFHHTNYKNNEGKTLCRKCHNLEHIKIKNFEGHLKSDFSEQEPKE